MRSFAEALLGREVRADPIPFAGLAVSLIGLVALMRLVRICRFRVEGESMGPLLRPGDRLLVRPTPRRRLRPGDLVVVRDPRCRRRRMVKRLARRDGAAAWLLGDNPPASTDSRVFGWVALPPVVGRPTRRYAPVGRAGPLAAR